MTEPDDLPRRVSALEDEVRSLSARVRSTEHDAAAARVLAGGADRDVAEILTEIRDFRDANNRTLNAMRADMTDMRTGLRGEMTGLRTELRGEMADLRTEMHTGFAQMRGALDAAAAGQQHIVDMLDRLIDRDDDAGTGREA